MSKKKKAVWNYLRVFWYRRQFRYVNRRAYRAYAGFTKKSRTLKKVLQKIITGGIVSVMLFLAAAGATALTQSGIRNQLLQLFTK